MLVTRTIQECIRNPEKTEEITEHIARNRDLGMQTFNQCLVGLVRSGAVTLDAAKMASTHPEELERDLTIE
jgi:twitching motility protein PilT